MDLHLQGHQFHRLQEAPLLELLLGPLVLLHKVLLDLGLLHRQVLHQLDLVLVAELELLVVPLPYPTLLLDLSLDLQGGPQEACSLTPEDNLAPFPVQGSIFQMTCWLQPALLLDPLWGVPVKICTTHNKTVTQQRLHRLFDKTKRKDMTPDQLMEYTDKVTKPVLARKYLLRLPPSDPEGTELLSTLSNNQQSLETFRAHLALLDCLDVTDVYSPIDCLNSPALGPECFNLFDNYATLTKD